MKKKKKNKKRSLKDPKTESFGLSFGALLKQSGVDLPKSKPKKSFVPKNPLPTKEPTPPVEKKEGVINFSDCGRVVIRKDTKRRRGKTVTVIRGLELRTEELMFLAQELRRTFGCGSTTEDDDLLLQGDQTLRVKDWLEAKGVKKVTLNR